MTTIHTAVAQAIADCAPRVAGNVINVLVDREVTKRADVLVRAIDLLTAIEKEFRKIKPDQISYDGGGKIVSETFSKAKLDERNKSQQNQDRLEKAIDKALGVEAAEGVVAVLPDFTDLHNIMNNIRSSKDTKDARTEQSSD